MDAGLFRRIVTRTLLIAVFWVALPLAVVELAFREYERRFLITERTLDEDAAVFDLGDLGYVEGPVAARSPVGRFRVLSLGDSFAQSIVEEPYTYASVLERALAARIAHDVRIINLGRGGTSFAGYLHELDRWGARLDYDAVLVNVFAGNDFSDAGTEIAATVFARGGAREPVATRPTQATVRTGVGTTVPRRHLLRIFDWIHAAWLGATLDDAGGDGPSAGYRPGTLQMGEAKYLQVQANTSRPYLRDTIAARPEGLASLAGLLDRLRALESEGKRTLVFVSPPEALVSEPIQQRVRGRRGWPADALELGRPASAVASVAGLVGYTGSVVDLGPCLLAAERAGTRTYHPRNTHWSVEGNEVVGESLAATLAHEWFPDRAVPDSGTCTERPAAAEPALARAAAQMVEATRLRAPLLAPLASETPRSREQVEAALDAAGLHRAEPIEIRLDQLLVRDAFVQLGGSLETARDAGESLLALLLEGRPIAAAALRRTAPTGSRARFSLRPSLRCSERRSEQELAMLVVSADTYRWGVPSKPIVCGPGSAGR
jgi:hypothetical protein